MVKHNVFEDAKAHFGEHEWLFQQDNARPHTAKKTLRFLKEKGINLLEDWPPYSPDLNVIEYVWSIMKRRLSANPVKSIPQMKQEIIKVWNELSLETINGLVDSMPKRLAYVIEKQGETFFSNELKKL